jgi:hypothetical protein
MQQAWMVGVLDILHHQLPVARYALAVGAEQRELAAIEDAAQPGHHVRADIIRKGGRIRIDARKNQSVIGGDLQFAETMLPEIEIGRHAALHLVAFLHAVAKGQTGKIAVQLVGPLVIGADEAAGITL